MNSQDQPGEIKHKKDKNNGEHNLSKMEILPVHHCVAIGTHSEIFLCNLKRFDAKLIKIIEAIVTQPRKNRKPPAINPEVEKSKQNERSKYCGGDGVETLEQEEEPGNVWSNVLRNAFKS